MKIIAFEGARVTALFPLEEVVPLGGADGREVLAALKSRYDFARSPDPASVTREETLKSGYKFEAGRFYVDNSPVNILDLSIYTDGIVISSTKTEYAESMIYDLIAFVRESFHFREFETNPRFYFLSQIIVEFESPLRKLLSHYDAIAQAIGEQLSPIYNLKSLMDFSRLDFEWDKKATALEIAVPRFIIERRGNIPFEKERYFCGAPMKTEGHIKVLEEIERALK